MKKLVSKAIYFSLGVITSDFIIYEVMHVKQSSYWLSISGKVVFLIMFFAWFNRDIGIDKQTEEENIKLKAEIEKLKRNEIHGDEESELNFFMKK